MTRKTSNKVLDQGKRSVLQIIFGRTMLILLLLLVQFLILLGWLYSLSQYVPYFFGSSLIFTAAMLIYVLNTRANPAFELSWCVLIALLPAFGSLLYLFCHAELGHRTMRKLVQRSEAESKDLLPQDPELTRQLKNEDPSLYNLAHYLQRCGGYPVCSNTPVQYFPVGEQMLEEMLRQLEKAKHFIFLEYFIIAQGQMWGRILEVLQRKAEEGVEVRVMYDGTSAVALLPYQYPEHLEKLGIRCKMFSPIRPIVSTHYNNRDHRKIMVIDGHTAFTGGINLSDEYINIGSRFGHWKDTAVMLQGEGARSFTRMFLQMWNATERNREYTPYLATALPERQSRGYVIPYADSPMDEESPGKMVYLDMINQAKEYVYIMTPYLILDHETVTAMRYAAKRGVDVRLILPHIPDKKTVFALAKSHYPELAEAGVRIYEYTPGFVHAKVVLSDDKHGVVGTINLDYRSLYLHFECAAYMYRVSALEDIKKDFDQTMASSQEITLEEVRRRGPLTRLIGAILKLAAPLM